MCFVFTCFTWLIDLVQRVWTFSMSCCIMSAVCGVMVTASMAGIALGYNYSLAEYIDLRKREPNESFYLRRRVFDDEVAGELEYQRSGRQPDGADVGQPHDPNLRTVAPEDDGTTTLRSGRRLEDSMDESDEQHKFEGSLMRLTAKSVQLTPKPEVTDDREMASAIKRHPEGSLDQVKAIQNLLDSRKMMVTDPTTNSPLATFSTAEAYLPYLPMINNPNVPVDHRVDQYKRMMATEPIRMLPGLPSISPASLAVPDPTTYNWLDPKYPAILMDPYRKAEFDLSSPTYPSPITVHIATVKPQQTTDLNNPYQPDVVSFSLNTDYHRKYLTTVAVPTPLVQEPVKKLPDVYGDRISDDTPSKGDDMKPANTRGKPTEEEYEDEIKGLPVRKRRSIRSLSEKNIVHLCSNERSKNSANQQVSVNKKIKSDLKNKDETIRKFHHNENKKEKSLFARLVALIEANLEEDITTKADLVTTKKPRIKMRKKAFESKIVSKKYVPNNVAKRLLEKKEPLSNQQILNSISVNLNEAGLLRNPASSAFVKFLQSSLTA